MAEVTASMVKALREQTGAGMMDCKNALTESDGELEAAVDWLRAKGLSKAAKKAGRVAAEGLVGVAVEGTRGAAVEVNSETDFVARNDKFQGMVTNIAELALANGGDFDKLAKAGYPGADKPVDEYVTGMIATIGENMSLRRSAGIAVDKGVVSSYVHNQTAPGLGKIGVLVGLESDGDAGKLAELGRQVAMHVAAANPMAVTADDLDPDVVERERAVLMEQARDSGKPEEIIAKMIEGRLRKYLEEIVLMAQTYVIDGENTVEKALKAVEADVGAPIKVKGFVRFQLGEGIEKEESDFAGEVASVAAGG